MRPALRILPLIAILALMAAALSLGWYRYLSWPAIASLHTRVSDLVAASPLLAGATYIATYALAVAASVPGAAVITVAGGLFFGAWVGTLLAVASATLGAVLLFLAARTALGPLMAQKSGNLIERLRPGLERDGFSYLLAARLVPVIPFWLANLAPAIVGMRLAPFAAATFLGIIPGTAVFAFLGAGFGQVLESGQTPNFAIIVSPPVLLPLLGLATLAIVPSLWRHWRRRHG